MRHIKYILIILFVCLSITSCNIESIWPTSHFYVVGKTYRLVEYSYFDNDVYRHRPAIYRLEVMDSVGQHHSMKVPQEVFDIVNINDTVYFYKGNAILE